MTSEPRETPPQAHSSPAVILLGYPVGPRLQGRDGHSLALVSWVTRGGKLVSASLCRLESLNNLSWATVLIRLAPPSGDANGERDPGTAALTRLLKIIGHPQCKETSVLLQFAWEM